MNKVDRTISLSDKDYMIAGMRGILTYMVVSLSGISCCAWILALNSVWVPTGPNWSLCTWVVLDVTFGHHRVSLAKEPFYLYIPAVSRQRFSSPPDEWMHLRRCI